jgi:chromate reductase, NAD(P)H dehydrogenase (quinone)
MCGSRSTTSANRAALDLAGKRVTSTSTNGSVHDITIDRVPMFHPDLVDDPPDPVADLREMIEGADGVMIAAPEYAGGVAGATKNALDWLVGSASLHHRPVAVLSAGTTGGVFAIEQLVRTLSWQGALVVTTLGISAPRTKTDANGTFTDPATVASIERWADDLVEAIPMSPNALLERVSDVIVPFGIDPTRLGDL